MSVNFTPSLEPYKETGSFKFWCQKVLPLVYDDSLSYYELLCKVVNYLNDVISNVDGLKIDIDKLLGAYNQLQDYVNNYFDNLDVQDEINKKLDEMAENGTLSALIFNTLPKRKILDIYRGNTFDEKITNLIQDEPNGCYVIIVNSYNVENAVTLPDNYTIDGNGTCTLTYLNENVTINAGNNNTFKNITLKSGHDGITVANAWYGICFGGTENMRDLVIDNCKFYNFGYAVRIRNSLDSKTIRNENITITNSEFNTFDRVVNAGGINIWESDFVYIANNKLYGGTTASAIGVTGSQKNVIITGNTIYGNKEYSIQLENFGGIPYNENANAIITGNITENCIGIDDSSNVIVSNNISGSILVTTQTEIVKTIVVNNNITGTVRFSSVYNPLETVYMENMTATNNILNQPNGYADNAVVSNSVGIFFASSVISGNIFGNMVLNSPNTPISVATSNPNFKDVYAGNNNVLPVATPSSFNLHNLTNCFANQFESYEEATNNQAGRIVYDKTKAAFYGNFGGYGWKKIATE